MGPFKILPILFLLVLVSGAWYSQRKLQNEYIPKSIDLLTTDARELAQLLAKNTITSVELVKEYYRRIDRDNAKGNKLRALLSTTPFEILIAEAEARDQERRTNETRSNLHGVPIIVKDNMMTGPSLGMKTTLGAVAFQNATADADATIIRKLREAGLIIIGKANLGELNGFKDDSLETGWSEVGGPSISPYDGKHPCGSSGGSAAAVAAGFAPLALGTETIGSISCPAAFNSLYGLKFSFGEVSRSGILASTTSFDSPGVFAKSAWDIGSVLALVAGPDSNDLVSVDAVLPNKKLVEDLHSDWSEWRIGVADKDWFWKYEGDIRDGHDWEEMFEVGKKRIAEIEKLGATIIWDCPMPSTKVPQDKIGGLMFEIIHHETKSNFDAFFSRLENTSVHNLAELVAFNDLRGNPADAPYARKQDHLRKALHEQLSEEKYAEAIAQSYEWGVTQGIPFVMRNHNLDALVLPGWSSMSVYAAWSKSPTATVPLGVYKSRKPYGLGFVANRFDDEKLVKIMDRYERSFPWRQVPKMQRVKPDL